ncbi:questin oxidase family protein [Streptomyces sp. NPDC059256]|uniref:questin oxidase family protein n=1 Tax=Streptomyces sp. NPDC059256 TaxID=3346794 RepID=UPI0036D09616
MDTTGTLDEALDRIHLSGPERHGWLSNHAPMAVEALVRHGQARSVHRWVDHYRDKLEEMPPPTALITSADWPSALGDPRRIADWALYFEHEVIERPWREVLAEWWPRLLPGIAGGATHPVIRVGHAVRTLLSGPQTDPRTVELAHALGYWAARHAPLPPLGRLGPASSAAVALDLVPAVPDQSGGIEARLERLTAFPQWPAPDALVDSASGPMVPASAAEAAHTRLIELVTAATHRYATHGHGEPVMLVHAATAPNAVLRTLPALPRGLWAPSLSAAWAASAAVTAAYTPATRAALPAMTDASPEEIFERAAAHGDDHTIKFTDTALDVGDGLALTAAVRSIELNVPFL